LPERVGRFAAALDEIRTEIRATVDDPQRRMRIMKQLVSDQTHREFLRGGPGELRAKLSELLEQ